MKLYFLTLFLMFVAWYLSSNETRKSGRTPLISFDNEYYFPPEMVVMPTTVDDLALTLIDANRKGSKVRVVGSGHSWSPVATSSNVIISLAKMTGIVSLNTVSKEVTVLAGTTLYDLSKLLEDQGYALPILPSISDQTVAGAVATATHMTGVYHKNMANLVTEFKMILANGTSVSVKKYSPLYESGLINIGLFGVITEITFQFVEAYHLKEIVQPLPLSECLEKMETLFHSAEHVKMWLEIHSESCGLFQFNRTEEKVKNNPSPLFMKVTGYLFEVIQWIAGIAPSCVGGKVMELLLKSGVVFPPQERIDLYRNVFNIPNYQATHIEAELSVALENCSAALSDLIDLVHTKHIVINYIIEVRVVAADKLWMSPNYNQLSCHITQLLYNPSEDKIKTYFEGFYLRSRQFRGRPHWGKWFHSNFKDMSEMYPKLKDFLQLRKEMDPKGIFVNDFLKETFDL